MSFKFRPHVTALEARDVPAAFSFALPDGTVGQGTFSTPALNPALTLEIVNLTDLTVELGGQALTVGSFASATYAYGNLVGVLATATGPSTTVSLTGSTVTVDNNTVDVAYDPSDTEASFTLPDGTTGFISYQVPWDQVDPDQSSQSVTPTAFNVNIGGQNFALGSASFTTSPTLQFANGDLVGFGFALNLTGSGLLYSSVSVANSIATAQNTLTQQFVNVPVTPKGSASITLDFANVTIPAMGSVKYSLEVNTADGKTKTVQVEVFAGATAADVHDLFETALTGAGVAVKSTSATKLNIQGTATSELKGIQAIDFGANAPRIIGRTPASDDTFPTYTK